MTTRADLVRDIFSAACDLQGAALEACLRARCGADVELRAEVERLLRADATPEFLAEPELSQLRIADAEQPPPATIGPFEIQGLLGRGGMGVVYRGRQREPSREVAVKVLALGAHDERVRARFANEAEALGRLQHPGIAQIYAAGTDLRDGVPRPYLAMELIDGEPLQRFVERARPPLQVRVRLLIEIADAVQHAHNKGLVHRDLKPGNVFVDRAGRAKVLDFGIARQVDEARVHTLQTMPGQLLGTLGYMSPEQAAGRSDVDARSDVYSLGVLGFELVSGRLPIDVQGDSIAAGLRKVAEAEPRRLGAHDKRLQGDLDTIFATALRKEPERRYATAAAFAEDLRRYLGHQPIQARPATAGYVLRRFARRHRGLVWGVALATLALVTGAGVAVAAAVRAARAEARAQGEAQVANRAVQFVEDLFSAAAPRVALGETISARDVVAQGVEQLGRQLGDQPALRGRLSRMLGGVLVELGDATTAEPVLAAAIAAFASLGPEGRGREADARLVRGRALHTLGRLADASAEFTACAALCAADIEPLLAARLDTARGVLARDQHDLPAAQAALATAAERFAALGLARDQAHALAQLGVVLQLARDFPGARERFRAALTLAERFEDPLFTATTATNLGNLEVAQGRSGEAETLFTTALQLGERHLGKDHPLLIRRLCNLAGVYGQAGRLADAETLLERAVALSRDVDARYDDGVAHALNNLANVRGMQQRHPEAIELWQRAAAIYERRGAGGVRALIRVLENIAHVHGQQGDADAQAQVRARIAALQATLK